MACPPHVLAYLADLSKKYPINKDADQVSERLDRYISFLLERNISMNLIGRGTMQDVWDRHVLDSLQLVPILFSSCPSGRILDMGTGAGFPGAVLSLIGVPFVTMIDSTEKKIKFLQDVSRETSTPFSLVCARIEKFEERTSFSVVLARALSPLERLFELSFLMLKKDGVSLFFKGKSYAEEVSLAKKKWAFTSKVYPSITNDEGKILLCKHLSYRHSS